MNKIVLLFILQNAYRSEKYNFRNKREWYRDLERSYTGKRLKEMIPDGINIKVINANSSIGVDAKSCFQPNINYIKKMIEKYSPDIICACGRIAQSGCKELGIEYIALPHPAWRQLSKKETDKIKKNLNNLLEVLL